jgi:DNA polymerase
MFVGLSSKPGTAALCPTTNSGKLIGEIEQRVAEIFNVYKTNLVKCAPLDECGKLRYPTLTEMKACLPRLITEIEHFQPKVIVPLGGQVTKFMINTLMSNQHFDGFADDFRYQTFSFNNGMLLPVHHPSYIWVYKRKRIPQYIDAVGEQLLEAVG